MPFKVVGPETVKALTLVVAKVLWPGTVRVEAVNWVAVVVARVEAPATFKVPPTVSKLEMVVEPVTAKVLVEEVKVKLEEVAKVLLPWPNRMSLAVRFWSWTVGVKPPEDRMEPLPLTAVT